MPSRLARWLVVAMVTAVGLGAACGGGQGAPSDRGPRPRDGPGEAQVSVAGPSTTAATTTTSPPSRFEFVDYRVSGGIAGVNDHLKVYPDGRATYDGGTSVTEFTVPPGAVAELRAALEQANVAALPPVNGAATPDALQHNVIFGGRSVRFVDGSMPPALGSAVAVLNRELARGKAAR